MILFLKRPKQGFTLMELLVTLALMSVIFGVLFSMLSGGIRVWQRLKCGVSQDHQVYLAFDLMRRRLHGIRPFKPILFKGSSHQMVFPTLISVEYEKDNVTLQEPGSVSYYFDANRQTLCQSEQLFRGMRRVGATKYCKPLAENVDSVLFQYQKQVKNSDGLVWGGHWSDQHPPVAVKMELSYHDPCSEQKSKKEFLISIPVGPIR